MRTPRFVLYRRRKLSAQLSNLVGWVEERHYQQQRGNVGSANRAADRIEWQKKEILDHFYPLLGRKSKAEGRQP